MMGLLCLAVRVLRCVREIVERVVGAYRREWTRNGADKWEGT